MKNKPTPPPLAWRLFQKFIPLDERKYLQQAMLEVFEDLYIRKSKRAAWFWFWGQFLRSLPAFLSNSLYWSVQMFKNYMRITFRNFKKHKFYSFINITGLAIGIAQLWQNGPWGGVSMNVFLEVYIKIHILTEKMAPRAGLEPATSSLTAKRSTNWATGDHVLRP